MRGETVTEPSQNNRQMSATIEPDSDAFRDSRKAFLLIEHTWKKKGFESLTDAQRDLHFIEFFWGRVGNGGLHNFLYVLEDEGFPYEEAMESLDRQELGILYNCFSEAIDLLREYLQSRNEEEEATTFDADDFRKAFNQQLHQLEEQFYAAQPQVENKMKSLIEDVLKTSDHTMLPKYER